MKLQEIQNARVGGVSCGMMSNPLAKCCLVFHRNTLSARGDGPDVGGTHLPSYLRKYQFSALFPLQVRRECVWTWEACVCQQGAEVIRAKVLGIRRNPGSYNWPQVLNGQWKFNPLILVTLRENFLECSAVLLPLF